MKKSIDINKLSELKTFTEKRPDIKCPECGYKKYVSLCCGGKCGEKVCTRCKCCFALSGVIEDNIKN